MTYFNIQGRDFTNEKDFFNPRVNTAYLNLHDSPTMALVSAVQYVLRPLAKNLDTEFVTRNSDSQTRQSLLAAYESVPYIDRWIFAWFHGEGVSIAYPKLVRTRESMVYITHDYFNPALGSRMGESPTVTHLRRKDAILEKVSAFKRQIEELGSLKFDVRASVNPLYSQFQMAYRYSVGFPLMFFEGSGQSNIWTPMQSDSYMTLNNISLFSRIVIAVGVVRIYTDSSSLDAKWRKIAKLFNYSANPFDYIEDKFLKSENDPPEPIFYGVELELTSDDAVPKVVRGFPEPFAIAKDDGSIRGNKANKMEIVTVPATLRVHKDMWSSFFDKLGYDNFDTSRDTNNGMHVHIDRKAFLKPMFEDEEGNPITEEDNLFVRKFSWFFANPKNKFFLLDVSERELEALETGYTCMPKFDTANKAFMSSLNKLRSIGHPAVVNVASNKPTIEVRLFKGIVSLATIVKNLEFVESVYHFTKQASIKDCDARSYLAWLEKAPRSSYRTLRVFLKEIDITRYDALERAITAYEEALRLKERLEGTLKASTSKKGRISHMDKDVLDALKKGRSRHVPQSR